MDSNYRTCFAAQFVSSDFQFGPAASNATGEIPGRGSSRAARVQRAADRRSVQRRRNRLHLTPVRSGGCERPSEHMGVQPVATAAPAAWPSRRFRAGAACSETQPDGGVQTSKRR